ncbi:RHS repeat-associated core domain-containing protein [Flavobacterium sp. ACAM 123]|uniref:RHS repeat-associated core domain-containing protein n=1 Tax=Flavobacterium sp. ACAM 123 TaxID=1189620 RepID=UPI0002D4308B|nr:RHS repeat-associated core domain-containing protein [Flavobacterium sp. ACAM 123]
MSGFFLSYIYKYKYNGKELQDELGLNVYDYGARTYMPDLGRWMHIDPLAEKFPSQSPYVFTDNNPINLIDPDGRAAVPPDDHFDSSGKFLYTDFRKTNNIVIHSGTFNFSQLNDEVQLKDFTFNKSNYSTLSNIAGHYSKDAGVNLGKVHNGEISVSDAIITGHKGGQPEGYIENYNDGVYSATDIYGSSTIMNTKGSTVTVNLNNGKVDPLLNDVNSFTATLDHEGGPIGHLVNPEKKHTTIYKDEIKKYSEKATPEFKKHISDNLEYYKKREE